MFRKYVFQDKHRSPAYTGNVFLFPKKTRNILNIQYAIFRFIRKRLKCRNADRHGGEGKCIFPPFGRRNSFEHYS